MFDVWFARKCKPPNPPRFVVRSHPAVRITFSVPIVDLTAITGTKEEASRLSWQRAGFAASLPPARRAFVRGLGTISPWHELWAPPGAPRSVVDATRLIRFSLENATSSTVLRANVLYRRLLAERDGVGLQLQVGFEWRARVGHERVELERVITAIKSLWVEVDGKSRPLSGVGQLVARSLADRMYPGDTEADVTSGQPCIVIEFRDGFVGQRTSRRVKSKLRLDSGRSLVALEDSDAVILEMGKKSALFSREPAAELLTVMHLNVQTMLALQATKASGTNGRKVRAPMVFRLKQWQSVSSSSPAAAWRRKLLAFYDESQGGAVRALNEHDWDAQVGEQIVNIKGNNNVVVGANATVGNVNSMSDSQNRVDSEALLTAVQALATSDERNQVLLAQFVQAMQEGRDKPSLKGIWDRVKGALSVVPAATRAYEAIEGLLAG